MQYLLRKMAQLMVTLPMEQEQQSQQSQQSHQLDQQQFVRGGGTGQEGFDDLDMRTQREGEGERESEAEAGCACLSPDLEVSR